MTFKRATKKTAKLRMGIDGPSGVGKTYSALAIAENLGKRVAVIDSERGSAAKYSDRFKFDVVEIEGNHDPENYITLINEAGKEGYDVLIVDSLTHSWNGQGGFLSKVEDLKKKRAGDNFTAWKTLTPLYNRLIETILSSPCHVIVTLRAKTEYSHEKDNNGKTVIRKLGTTPEIRENFSFELDISGSMNQDHEYIVNKSRCSNVDNKVFLKPGKEFAEAVLEWLNDGSPPTERQLPVAVPVSSKLGELQALISLTPNKEHLQNVVAAECRKSQQEGLITREEYESLIPMFKEKMKELS